MSILLQGIHFKKRLMPILFSLVLASCSNMFGDNFTSVLKNDANASSEFYINKLQQPQLSPEDQQTYKLLAARVLITENKIPQAEAFLSELTELNDEQKLDRTLVMAMIQASKKENEQANNLLNSLDLKKLSPSQLSRYYETKAMIATNQGDLLEAVKQRVKMSQVLTDTQRKQQNNDTIWSLLRRANTATVNNASDDANAELGGWLALIKAYNDNLSQPVQLSQALQNWKNAYPNHSAAYLFPKELQGMLNFQQTNFAQIGLLLPLSGDGQSLGTIIQSGFNDAKGDSGINIRVFDTMAMPVNDIITQAKAEGIKALVGPLLKQNLDTVLANAANLQGVDVLALNSTPNAYAMSQMCYYGLSPEDEAESAATKMWNDGVRQPLVAVPQNNLGQRIANAFNIRWQQLASMDADIRYFTSPLDVLNFITNNANQALYMVSNADEVGELKSVLNNNGQNIQIYTSSRTNASSNTPEFKQLMSGVQFSDIPFFKDMNDEQYRKVAASTGGEYQSMRLYAMGSDAWLLINHFNELRQVPGFQLNGLTGKLSAGKNCDIERDMTWFQYQDGNIVPIKN